MSSGSRREHASQHQREPGPSLQGHAPTCSSEPSQGGIAGAVKEKAQDLASSLGARGEEMWQTARQGASAVADTVGSGWDEVSSFVSRHPWATFAVGGGVAFLLFRALSERSAFDYYTSGWRSSYPGRGFAERQGGYGWGRDRGYDAASQRGYDVGRSAYYQPRERPSSQGGEGATNAGAGSFSERAQEMASAAAERVGQAWESAREGTCQLASTVADRAGDAWETMGDWGRGYPLGTLLVGAALGFGLNELLRSQGILGTRNTGRYEGSSTR